MKDLFDIFRTFINTMETSVQELAKKHGMEHLAGPQGFTVSYLFENRDKEIFIKDIEERLRISKSVASNLIKRMEKNGFIQVKPSLKDKRYKQIVLTELGFDKAEKIKVFRSKIEEIILKDIDKKNLEVARRVFLQIKTNLEK
ncbi:MarR family winged helix-turn-helix transcriptional regulator [Streptococcus sobrinus]|uniref:MarR family winged helix-turn-helix transcriptional regulator n=1 Tax=Streptococcus sobrinus TaxID=1310 RepID=UPI0002E68175|nr:MarR family transcriptional regulator [Streptococcus sobrinus]